MPKIVITTNGTTDYLVVPRVMAVRLTRDYWMVVNQSVLPDWGVPAKSLKLPTFPAGISEQKVRDIVSASFGKIVAEREEGEKDEGWVGLGPVYINLDLFFGNRYRPP